MDAITLWVVIGYDTRDREQRPVDYIFLNMFKQYRWKNKALWTQNIKGPLYTANHGRIFVISYSCVGVTLLHC